ncbi:MAG: hypothetical protein ACXVJ7_07490 [Acidimicrobiia bacterium]
MAVAVTLRPDTLSVSLTGWDSVWAVKRTLSIPWSDVVGARVVTVEDARQRLGWRLAGTGVPGVAIAGTRTVIGEPGARELWAVYRDPQALEIETRLLRPKRIVLQVPDREELAAAINARIAPA